MKTFRKRLTWLLLVLFLLPVLITSVWYYRQVRQQRLDHALIEAIKKEDTQKAIALLDEGADANTVDKPYTPVTFKSVLTDFWNRAKGNKTVNDDAFYSTPLRLLYPMNAFLVSPGVLQKMQLLNYKPPQEHAELVRALMAHGAVTDGRDRYGRTILYYATADNHAATVKVLLEYGVNPNIRDNQGLTSLWFANSVCARLLIAGGGKVSIMDYRGSTPLEYVEYVAGIVGAGDDKDLIPLLEAALKKEQAEQKSSVSPR